MLFVNNYAQIIIQLSNNSKRFKIIQKLWISQQFYNFIDNFVLIVLFKVNFKQIESIIVQFLFNS